MLGYHDYKALHLVGLIFFLIFLVRLHTSEKQGYFFKPLLYSSAFLTITTGTILMVNWGLLNEMPPWIWGKFIATFGLVISIWLPRPKSKFFKLRHPFIAGMIFLAVICSVYKPI